MDYLLSQPPLLECYSEDAQNQGQFDWSLLGTGPTLNNTDAPGTLSDNGFDPIFTPEQLAMLLQTCDSPYPADSFSQDFSTECLNQPEWNLQPFPDFTFQSLDFNNPFIPASQPPTVTDPTTYRDGFGNPIKPVDYQPTYDSSAGFEIYSSPPAMPSSSYSPSDAYPGYAYPPPQPPPVVERTNHWDLVAGPNSYSPSKNPARSDVTSPSAASEQPVKKHRCQICGRAFQRQTTLTQHQITHTGERPYSCPVAGCGKAFTTASNAKRHAKTHFRISHGFHSSPGPY